MKDFIFKEEPELDKKNQSTKMDQKWRILIVDDDDTVHEITKLVLSDIEFEGRALEFISVYSIKEAKQILINESDVCLAFVDVVMETDHAGLDLVQWVREKLKNKVIRLVLRTGQAGTAPAQQVIKNYDINDYKDKTDFTSNNMISTVFSNIRAYRDMLNQ